MKRALLIASAVAAVVAGQALAESGSDQPIDEKCYGVSPHDVSECGGDAQTCARMTSAEQPAKDASKEAAQGKDDELWAYVPKGTCVKIYRGSLTPKTS
ncbi:MAG TPA: DUF2282 domain-containing protein [Alphaproteobacteria bacterium]|nr:DUF2282 domain-containing protein [Alphaproteobacteria bacterium]